MGCIVGATCLNTALAVCVRYLAPGQGDVMRCRKATTAALGEGNHKSCFRDSWSSTFDLKLHGPSPIQLVYEVCRPRQSNQTRAICNTIGLVMLKCLECCDLWSVSTKTPGFCNSGSLQEIIRLLQTTSNIKILALAGPPLCVSSK